MKAGGRQIDPVDNQRATAQELVSFARQKGFDLESVHDEFMFQGNERWVFFWRKDELPADEKKGTLHYNMQGAISVLPSSLKESGSAFRGAWTEAGILDNIEGAFELVRAWLLDRKEVDDLPKRCVRRYGI